MARSSKCSSLGHAFACQGDNELIFALEMTKTPTALFVDALDGLRHCPEIVAETLLNRFAEFVAAPSFEYDPALDAKLTAMIFEDTALTQLCYTMSDRLVASDECRSKLDIIRIYNAMATQIIKEIFANYTVFRNL